MKRWVVVVLLGIAAPLMGQTPGQWAFVPDTFVLDTVVDVIRTPLTDQGFAVLDRACHILKFPAIPGSGARWAVRLENWTDCRALTQIPDGNLAVVARTGGTVGLAILNDTTGQAVWIGGYQFFPPPGPLAPEDILATPQGLVIVGWVDTLPIRAFALFTSPVGVPWTARVYAPVGGNGDTLEGAFHRIVLDPASQDLLFLGVARDTAFPDSTALWWVPADPAGNPYGHSLFFPAQGEEHPRFLKPVSNGNWLLGGSLQDISGFSGFLLMLDGTGTPMGDVRVSGTQVVLMDAVEVAGQVQATGWTDAGNPDGLFLRWNPVSGGVDILRSLGGDSLDLLSGIFEDGSGFRLWGITRDSLLPRPGVWQVLAGASGNTCAARAPGLASSPAGFSAVQGFVVVDTLSPDLASGTTVIRDSGTTVVVCTGTGVEERHPSSCRGSIRLEGRAVIFERPMRYRLLRVDGRQIREGRERRIPLQHPGVYVLQIREGQNTRIFRVVVP